MLPPLPTLPPELLSEIFAYSDAIYRNTQSSQVLTPRTPVYQLYRVCKTWRQVALDTPELWTCVTIRGTRTMLRAEKWLEHAKKRLCTVWVKSNTGKFTSDVAFELLGLHMDHIRMLQLDVVNQRTDLIWPNVSSSIMHLTIGGCSLNAHEFLILLSLNPRLEKLGLRLRWDQSFRTGWTEHNIQPTRLTHLDVSTADFEDLEDLVRVLRLCPNLKFLHVVDGWTASTATLGTDAAELPDLQAMSLPLWSDLSRRLLPLLITPSLQQLLFTDLTCNQMEAALNHGNLGELEKKLLIDEELMLDPEVFAFFFQHMPGLQELVVDGFGLGSFGHFDAILEVLTSPDQDGRFALPDLRHLTLRNGWAWGGSLSIINQRYEGVAERDCHIPVPLKWIDVERCWVTGGWNSLEHLCQEYGTQFWLWDEQMRYKWDRSLMSKADIREWKEQPPEYVQSDDEWVYDDTTDEEGHDSAKSEDSEREDSAEGHDSPEAMFLKRWLISGKGGG